LSRLSDDEFWRVSVPRAREELRALLAAHPLTPALERPGQGFLGSLLFDWIAADGRRVLSVHLLEADEPIELDYFFKTLSSAGEPRELCLRLREPKQHTPLIVDCLERWLNRAEDEEKLSALLDGYGA
jgi:hypothetical protein